MAPLCNFDLRDSKLGGQARIPTAVRGRVGRRHGAFITNIFRLAYTEVDLRCLPSGIGP
jgi:hypothetical protein